MKVLRAEFRAAASRPAEIPPPRAPEIALAGRSNVGKSSLLNRLVRRRRLARTSQTPGCTRGLVFYDLDDRLTLVDLPGYGWARRSKQERAGWRALVEYYLESRSALVGVLLLIDVRRGPEAEERELAAYLDARGVAHAWVLTKCDKLTRSRLAARRREIVSALEGATVIVTSAVRGEGIKDLWAWIGERTGERRREVPRA